VNVKRYLELNGKYWREAMELLEKGDYIQASEKLWGASAEAVKAVAASRGITLGTHASLFQFVSQLARENPELGLVDAFHVANSLYTNFYEGWLTGDFVKRGAEIVQGFIDKLKNLIKTNAMD